MVHMGSFAEILPLAITMMAGPQIISAVMIITGKYPVKSSVAYVASVALAVSAGTLGLLVLFSVLGVESLTKKNSSGSVVETFLIGALVLLSLKTFLNRAEIKAPKWMESLQAAEPKAAFKLGLTLILVMPSDILIMTTVALHLTSRGASFFKALPFVFTTTLIAGLPLILYGVFHRRAAQAMPAVRGWMESHSWLIQIAVYLIFVFLLWK